VQHQQQRVEGYPNPSLCVCGRVLVINEPSVNTTKSDTHLFNYTPVNTTNPDSPFFYEPSVNTTKPVSQFFYCPSVNTTNAISPFFLWTVCEQNQALWTEPSLTHLPTCWIRIQVFLRRSHTNTNNISRLLNPVIWHGYLHMQGQCIHKTGWLWIEYRIPFLALRIQHVRVNPMCV